MIKKQLSPSLVSYQLQYNELRLDQAELISILGYPDNEAPPHVLQELLDIEEKSPGLCNCQAVVRYIDSYSIPEKGKLQLNDTIFDCGKIITTQLRNAKRAVLFLCTIGPQMETWANEQMNMHDYVKGYFVNHLASALVDATMDVVHNDIAADVQHQGDSVSNRFSPGYCGWNVSQQKRFFEFFPNHNCGISLTESCLMVPIKSISGIIGIGPKIQKLDYACKFCDLKDCVYRRKS